MASKSVEVMTHPAFSDVVREVEGADLIRKYKDAGWLPATSAKTPEAPASDKK